MENEWRKEIETRKIWNARRRFSIWKLRSMSDHLGYGSKTTKKTHSISSGLFTKAVTCSAHTYTRHTTHAHILALNQSNRMSSNSVYCTTVRRLLLLIHSVFSCYCVLSSSRCSSLRWKNSTQFMRNGKQNMNWTDVDSQSIVIRKQIRNWNYNIHWDSLSVWREWGETNDHRDEKKSLSKGTMRWIWWIRWTTSFGSKVESHYL